MNNTLMILFKHLLLGLQTNTTAAAATVIDMSSTEDAIVDMTSAGVRGGPAEMTQVTV